MGACKVVILDTLQDSETLHLKCLVTPLNADTLVVCSTDVGKALLMEINGKSGINYNAIEVPDQVPANVLALGSDFAIIQKKFPESEKVLNEELSMRGYKVEALDMSELIKAVLSYLLCSTLPLLVSMYLDVG
jgi:N-dimethylarginine dimethylaminohydrolase